MFSKAVLLGLATAALVAAAPNPFPETTCTTSTTCITYEIETTIPYYETSTSWLTTASTVEGFVTGTSTWYNTKTIVTETPSCVEISYPVEVWVTKKVTTQVPVTTYSTCTESSVWTEPTCTTVWTSIPEDIICTEYSTSCITTTEQIVTTICETCAPTPTPTPTPIVTF